jgi:hypothetical protein
MSRVDWNRNRRRDWHVAFQLTLHARKVQLNETTA